MTPKTAEDVKKGLEKVMKYSTSESERAIAAGVLSLMLDMRNLYTQLLEVERRLSQQ